MYSSCFWDPCGQTHRPGALRRVRLGGVSCQFSIQTPVHGSFSTSSLCARPLLCLPLSTGERGLACMAKSHLQTICLGRGTHSFHPLDILQQTPVRCHCQCAFPPITPAGRAGVGLKSPQSPPSDCGAPPPSREHQRKGCTQKPGTFCLCVHRGPPTLTPHFCASITAGGWAVLCTVSRPVSPFATIPVICGTAVCRGKPLRFRSQ